MTAPIVGVTSTPRRAKYVSVDMFKSTRRGVDIDNLVPRGSPPDQDAALAAYIDEACARVDSICQQTLAATYDTVAGRVNVNRDGYAIIHPRFRPVIAVTAFSIGPAQSLLSPIANLTGTQVMEDRFAVPVGFAGFPTMSSQGPIQFGASTSFPADQQFCQYTYVNGYPVTTLTAPCNAGDTTISVDDTTGIVAGLTWLTIASLDTSFTFQAGAVSTAGSAGIGTGPGTVVCPSIPKPITTNTPYPIQVSALPRDVIQASILIVRALIKEAGGSNITGPSTIAAGQSGRPVSSGMRGDTGAGDMETAEKILIPYHAPVA